jgi:hypothetical protein
MEATTPLSPLDEIRCKLDADHAKIERYWRVRSMVCCVLAAVLFLVFCAIAFSVNKTAPVITMGLAATLVLLGMELSRVEYEWAKRLPEECFEAYRREMVVAKQSALPFRHRTRPLYVADLEKLREIVGALAEQEFLAIQEPARQKRGTSVRRHSSCDTTSRDARLPA